MFVCYFLSLEKLELELRSTAERKTGVDLHEGNFIFVNISAWNFHSHIADLYEFC